MKRPNTNNADEWHAWFAENRESSAAFLAVQVAEAFDEISARSALLDRMQTERLILIGPDEAVAVGGRWDGWVLRKHSDGKWVTMRKCVIEYPRSATGGI